jgi:hypothetical protein
MCSIRLAFPNVPWRNCRLQQSLIDRIEPHGLFDDSFQVWKSISTLECRRKANFGGLQLFSQLGQARWVIQQEPEHLYHGGCCCLSPGIDCGYDQTHDGAFLNKFSRLRVAFKVTL